MRRLAIGLFVCAVVLGSCSSGDGSDSDDVETARAENQQDPPVCSELFVEGETIPEDFVNLACYVEAGDQSASLGGWGVVDCTGDDTFVAWSDHGWVDRAGIFHEHADPASLTLPADVKADCEGAATQTPVPPAAD